MKIHRRKGWALNKKTKIGIAIFIGVISIALPVATSMYMAEKLNQAEQQERVDRIASEVLLRMDQVANETFEMFQQMKVASLNSPCSEENIARMRRIVMQMNHLKAVGYVKDNHMLCSSFGHHDIGSAGLTRLL